MQKRLFVLLLSALVLLSVGSLRAQFDLSAGIGGYAGYVDGVGLSLWPRYSPNDRFQVGLQTGAFFWSTPVGGGRTTTIPVIGTFTYQFSTGRKLQPFVGGGLGLMIQSTSAYSYRLPPNSFGNEMNVPARSDSYFAINLHAGLNYSLSSRYYLQLRTGFDYMPNPFSTAALSLHLGVGYRFSR